MDENKPEMDETPVVIDQSLDRFEHEVVARIYDRVIADPSQLLTSEELQASMREWDREDEELLKRSA